RFALLALGKLGGRELNYHSDLDLLLIYEGDGGTVTPVQAHHSQHNSLTDNFHFYSELAQRIIKAIGSHGPMGRLYQVDMRLRPTGKSGSLVMPLDEFVRYFSNEPSTDGLSQSGVELWEYQVLTRARFVTGDVQFGATVNAAIARIVFGLSWRVQWADEIVAMRHRIEASRSPRSVKRGHGGLMDVEFLIELLKIKYGKDVPSIREPNTWEALVSLEKEGLLSPDEAADLRAAFEFLVRVQSQLRLLHNRSVDEVPESLEQVANLAKRLGFESDNAASQLESELKRHRIRARELFFRIIKRERSTPPP
ncbi:MAG: hypothetical protein ACRD36_05255, partial [Candidatus Acidiferrum sp.]